MSDFKIRLFLISFLLHFVATFNMQPTANYTQYVFQDSKGLIYFGGKGGFQILDPRKMEMADAGPPTETIIKDFQFLE